MRLFSRRIHKSIAKDCEVDVTETDGMRHMHLGSVTVQSSMLVKDPDALALEYSRGIVCFLLFSKKIKSLLTIGLGGGSVTKYVYAYCKEIKQTILEINPEVIRVARTHFYVPENDERLDIIAGDGVQHLLDNPDSQDCVVIDGFDSHGIPPNLCSPDFFDSCYEALHKHGIFVMNLWGSDQNFDVYLQRIEHAFSNRVLVMPTGKTGNIIVFGFKAPMNTTRRKMQARAKDLEQEHDIEFVKFLDMLHSRNGYQVMYSILEAT